MTNAGRAAAFAGLTLTLGWLGGCGGGATVVPATPTPAADPTLLALVRAPAARAEPTECLFVEAAGGTAFAAPLTPSISPMPEPSPRSAELLRTADTFTLVSRWGLDGTQPPYVASVTPHPPPSGGRAVLLLLDDDRVLIRSTWAEGPKDEGLALDAVAARLAFGVAIHPVVLLSATPRTRLSAIARLARELDGATFATALAVVVEPAEPLTGPPPIRDDDTGRCARLPPAPTDATYGGLAPAMLALALPAFRDATTACTAATSSRAVAVGGPMRLALRLSPAGAVTEACFRVDEVRDAAFRACVLDAARTLRFPAPSPEGIVDLELPFTLARDVSSASRAFCRASDLSGP